MDYLLNPLLNPKKQDELPSEPNSVTVNVKFPGTALSSTLTYPEKSLQPAVQKGPLYIQFQGRAWVCL